MWNIWILSNTCIYAKELISPLHCIVQYVSMTDIISKYWCYVVPILMYNGNASAVPFIYGFSAIASLYSAKWNFSTNKTKCSNNDLVS